MLPTLACCNKYTQKTPVCHKYDLLINQTTSGITYQSKRMEEVHSTDEEAEVYTEIQLKGSLSHV